MLAIKNIEDLIIFIFKLTYWPYFPDIFARETTKLKWSNCG